MSKRFQGWSKFLTGKKKNKYGNHQVEAGGEKFDSKREYNRWVQLQWKVKLKLITQLERQVRYPLLVNGEKIADYICDFQYQENGQLVVEDAKGVRTPAYRLKKKLMKSIHNIKIKEV